ncbi:MAG: outer membrane protein assembly factor BamD [Chlamydiales bacterium]|nr:outer membrane protein assembly factor BamD [Chlamydiales bacterium]
MKKTLFLLAFLMHSAFAYPPLPEARTEGEALFARRIVGFWRDKEYPFVKSQVRAYMNAFPSGPFTDHFYALLGDIALHERSYEEALEHYRCVSDQAVSEHLRVKRWQALYQLQLYRELYREIAFLGHEVEDEGKFYLAEAAFREALNLKEASSEEAMVLCKEALPLYASLTSNALFGTHAKLAMAEIYRILEKPEAAANLYLEIADSEESPYELLFQAAALLAHRNPEQAATLFERIARGSSRMASEAAHQWLQILATRGEWKTIAHERDLWLAKIVEEHRAVVYYYLGMLAFDEGKYYQAQADLQKALEKGIAPPQDRTVLETLLTSAGEVNNLVLCDLCYTLLTERYPDQRAQAGYVRAASYRKAGETEQALALFEELTHQFPMGPVSEKAGAEKIKLLMEEKRWDEAHESVLRFLEHHPQSGRKGEMLRLSVELASISASEGELYSRLAEDLELAFAARVFQADEREEKESLLALSYIKLGKIHPALGLLHEMKNPDPLLFAQCYIKEGNSPEKVILFGEKALEKNPGNDRLHLHLFNAYLQLSKKRPGDEELTEKAAAHLDAVIDIYPVTLENRLWLAHYFARLQNERALYLLETLLQTESNRKRFDEEALMLARLYQKKGALKKACSLAEKIIALDQKTKPEGELILAEALRGLGEGERAEKIFSRLEESPYLPVAYEASLNLAKMRFTLEPEKSLRKLHNLIVRKKLVTEPIHLEAALERAGFIAALAPEEERTGRFLEALLEVKEEFTSERDISSKDYHESRRLLPEKEKVYQAYMCYLDARIYKLQADLAVDPEERSAKESEALTLFSELQQRRDAMSGYLAERLSWVIYE